MTVKNPKAKGSAFERRICKMLSLWWSDGARDDLCWRSSNSGGRATFRSKQGKETSASYGDIFPLDKDMVPFFKVYTLDAKSGYSDDLNLFDSLDKSKGLGLFDKFWQKLEKDCEAAAKAGWGREPMLIFKRNKKEILMAVNYYESFYNLRMDYGIPRFKKIEDDTQLNRRIICKLEDFLNWANPEYFRRK